MRRDISAHYIPINLLCVLIPISGYGTNADKNKEANHYLNQGATSLVLKLKVHLIPLILRVTLDIFSIFQRNAFQSKIQFFPKVLFVIHLILSNSTHSAFLPIPSITILRFYYGFTTFYYGFKHLGRHSTNQRSFCLLINV